MPTPIRMKKKLMNKIHLDINGQQVISVIPAASDAPSKGISAQPPNILTPQETTGLPGGVSIKEPLKGEEVGTGAPTERVAPEAAPTVEATSLGAVELPAEMAEETVSEATPSLVPEAQSTEASASEDTSTSAEPLGLAVLPALDPNGQKAATLPEQANTGEGKVVGETESAPVAPTTLEDKEISATQE